IITAAGPAATVFPKPIYDLGAAHNAVDRIEQSYANTDLPGAFQKALQIGREESRQPNKQLCILSDSTRSAWDTKDATALANLGKDLAKVFRVTHYNLSKPNAWNQAVLEVKPTGKLIRSRFDNEMQTLVRGFGAGPTATLQWRLDNQPMSGGGNLELAADTAAKIQPLPRSN